MRRLTGSLVWDLGKDLLLSGLILFLIMFLLSCATSTESASDGVRLLEVESVCTITVLDGDSIGTGEQVYNFRGIKHHHMHCQTIETDHTEGIMKEKNGERQ